MLPAALLELDEQLGGHERAARLEADALERRALEELEGAVDVAHAEPVEDVQREAVGTRVGGADERIGALEAVAGDDVGSSGRGHAIEQPGQVGDPELAVAVGEGDEVVARGAQAAAHGRAIALVDLVVHDADVWIRRSQAFGNLQRGVAAAVVDGNDLELVRERRQLLERLGDERLDVLGLVVRGKEVGQRRDARLVSARRPSRRSMLLRRPRRGIIGSAAVSALVVRA